MAAEGSQGQEHTQDDDSPLNDPLLDLLGNPHHPVFLLIALWATLLVVAVIAGFDSPRDRGPWLSGVDALLAPVCLLVLALILGLRSRGDSVLVAVQKTTVLALSSGTPCISTGSIVPVEGSEVWDAP